MSIDFFWKLGLIIDIFYHHYLGKIYTKEGLASRFRYWQTG